MPPLLRTAYGMTALATSVLVFAFLQHREEQEDRAQAMAEQVVTSVHFLRAVERLPFDVVTKRELQRFWRSLCNANATNTNAASAKATRLKNESFNPANGNEVSDATSVNTPDTGSPGASEDGDDTNEDAQLPCSEAFKPVIDASIAIRMQDLAHFAYEYEQAFPKLFAAADAIRVAHVAAVAPSTHWGQELVHSTGTMLRSTGKRFHELAKDTQGEMQHVVHRAVQRYLEHVLDVVADRLKFSLKDRDMPGYLQTNIDLAVDRFMPDVKVEIFRKTRNMFSVDVTPKQSVGSYEESSVVKKKLSLLRRLRGHILYHLFPHNKSIWMSFKDPWWIAFSGIGVFPVVGQLWWLLLFLIKNKTDEHQLCQFIVGFKAAQFISLGLFSSVFGVFLYLKCIVQGALDGCRASGPSLESWSAFFFILQTALVWVAFFWLPYTIRPAKRQHRLLNRSQSIDARTKIIQRDVFGNIMYTSRGGYLMKLCGYETVSFSLITALTCLLLWLPFEPWQRKALFYWLRTAYGLFSLPFLVFKIPVLAKVLMHTHPMGYNQQGETVAIVKTHVD